MSFILNALRKSEQERLSNPTATLENKILLKQGEDQKKKPGWFMILIIINLLLFAFLLWHFSQPQNEDIAEKPLVVSEIAKAPLKIKEEAPVVVSEPAKTQAEKPVQVQDPKLISPPQITIAQQIKNLQEKKKEPPKRPTSSKSDQIIQAAKVNQVSPKVVKKRTVEQEVKNHKPAAFVMSNKDNDPPYLSDMPYEFSLSVPKININVFVYSEYPKDRFIMINMRKYLAGEQIEKGMELREIRADSLVVEYKDKVFQIKR